MTDAQVQIDLTLEDKASIYRLGDGVLAGLTDVLAGRSAAAIIDAKVSSAHSRRLRAALADENLPVYVVPGAETFKTLAGLAAAIRWLATTGLTRDGVLIGIGGGAVLDLAGLAASLWHRGVAYIALPSTLVAMVDAAVGGKTAVNAAGLKNPVGTYHPAEAILADPELLTSLPRTRWREGLAEMIKAAVVGEPRLFAELEAQGDELARSLASGDPGATVPDLLTTLPWTDWIGRAVGVKAALIECDFRDEGPRQALNFGHTLGHALEARTAGTRHPLPHGEAIAVGMAVTARIAAARRECPIADADRLITLLADCGLPTTWPPPPRAELERLLAGDKKRRADRLGWVLPNGIGRVQIGQSVTVDEVLSGLTPGSRGLTGP